MSSSTRYVGEGYRGLARRCFTPEACSGGVDTPSASTVMFSLLVFKLYFGCENGRSKGGPV